MKVLVCGGAGYIGSHMVALLAAEGHEPVVYDNLSKGHKTAVHGVPFVQGDLSDQDLLTQTLKRYKADAVMHFAAFIEVGESVQQPLRYYQNNCSNTRTVLAAMEAAGTLRFVFSSTAAVYGMPEQAPIT
jgi:UDP-glucose 4-epimerase